jgi:uncharacterized protein
MKTNARQLKRISNIAFLLLSLIFVIMLTDVTLVYIKWPSYLIHSTPDAKALRHALFYLPCLIAALSVHIVFYRKLRKEYPEQIPNKEKPDKKKIIKRMIKALAITIAVLLILLLIAPYIALPVFTGRHVNYLGYITKNNTLQDIYQASDYDLDETQRYLTTEDGIRVWTSEIYTEQPKAVMIFLSGIMQPSVTYFYGHAKYMKENQIASILLEVRGHGQSEGSRISLGYEEVKDVRAVVDYIRSEAKYDGVSIVIQGMSMGGAIAVNSFGQIEEIDALIAMSAYSSFEDVTTDQMKGYGIPGFILKIEKPIIRSALGLIFGKDLADQMKPIEQIKNAKGRPVLLVACTGDTEVPPINLQRLKDAYPDAQVWIRDSWEHFIVKDCNLKEVAQDKEYCDKIMDFINHSVLE